MLAVSGYKHNCRRELQMTQRIRQLQTRCFRHVNVQENHIAGKFLQFFNCFADTARFCNDLGLARFVQQKAQLGTSWSLIVNDHSFKHGYLLCRIIDNVRQYIAIGRFSHSLVRPRIRKARQRAHALGS